MEFRDALYKRYVEIVKKEDRRFFWSKWWNPVEQLDAGCIYLSEWLKQQKQEVAALKQKIIADGEFSKRLQACCEVVKKLQEESKQAYVNACLALLGPDAELESARAALEPTSVAQNPEQFEKTVKQLLEIFGDKGLSGKGRAPDENTREIRETVQAVALAEQLLKWEL